METPTVARPGMLRRALFPVELLLWVAVLFVTLQHYQQMGRVYAELGAKLPALTLFWIDLSRFLHNFSFVLILPIGFWLAITAVWLIGRININVMIVVELALRFVLMGALILLLIGVSLPLADCCAVIR